MVPEPSVRSHVVTSALHDGVLCPSADPVAHIGGAAQVGPRSTGVPHLPSGSFEVAEPIATGEVSIVVIAAADSVGMEVGTEDGTGVGVSRNIAMTRFWASMVAFSAAISLACAVAVRLRAAAGSTSQELSVRQIATKATTRTRLNSRACLLIPLPSANLLPAVIPLYRQYTRE